ncbi:MAG: NADH-quinone oxidoreductase subunit C/D [Chromatiaceae bacterium]
MPEPGTAARRAETALVDELRDELAETSFTAQETADGIPTLWIERKDLLKVLRRMKSGVAHPYPMLYDLTAIDERVRRHQEGQPKGDFTAVYQLLSPERDRDLRLKVALAEDDLSLPSAREIYRNADWYEREVWDLFGVHFEGHPHLTRILMPPTWEGHPLRKDHPARATELPEYSLSDERQRQEQEAMRFRPEDWGMERAHEDTDFLFLNLGPNHPGTHGVFRVIIQLDGEEIIDAVPDIGFHHRGAEKMGERQTWHSYIPYTDRIDYLGGVMNNLPYVLTVEKLAGIRVPARVEVIRVMLCELFRIASHLLFFGTMVQDMGQMSPVFYTFSDRQKIYDIIEAVCGFRMHPAWFRIGGLADDLPEGWQRLVRDLLEYLPPRLDEYERMSLRNGIFRRRTRHVGAYTTAEALEWGATGPGLRATGMEWDLRKARPYSGYDQFEFDIPIGERGDCYDRTAVRLEEMRQSLRIVEQCLENMPLGEHKARHPLTTPPLKDYTMHDIETLIHHFVEIGWGPIIPPGEASTAVEATKGINSYYLVSDGGNMSYRTRIRTPSFAHLQMIPAISRGHTVADLIAILGSIDFVMADVDR